MRDWIRDTAGKKEQQFRVQFRDSIQEMSAVLKAGYSVENAIREVSRELVPLYDKESRIRKEYDRMTHQLELKMPIAEVLEQFAERTGQEDVEDFVNVFAAAKKSGGDSITIIRNAVRIISGKIDTEKEIQTMIASNKLEFEIMCAVPFAIILYMKLTFGEFLSVLYGNMAGMIIMTVCLCVYIAAYCIGRRIIRIEV
ncbi:type II secretion system F family protein [Mediterraneibacter glycyrrhizinilyticus]|nr:type II secretion system F family protein [Mediterraneibacter glycyrrhizinilyticus]